MRISGSVPTHRPIYCLPRDAPNAKNLVRVVHRRQKLPHGNIDNGASFLDLFVSFQHQHLPALQESLQVRGDVIQWDNFYAPRVRVVLDYTP
eukprot:scaffold8106_cov403-Prasinococcus_capsulatus_cf.AAC.2